MVLHYHAGPTRSTQVNGRLETTEFKRGPGGRPTRQEAERRHLALLETATRLFLAGGIDAVSMDEIAKQA
jgi:hypothetical protein